MNDDAPDGERAKPTIGQAIDQVIAALGAFKAADQQTILRTVYAHLNISGPADPSAANKNSALPPLDARPPGSPPAPPPAPPRGPEGEFAGMDIKTFKDLKSPASARQMACVVAYYLAEIADGDERKEIISITDVEKYFKQGRFALPSSMDRLLVDCRAAGYFESPTRGEYKLTRVGHNLVAHQLPAKGKG